MFTKEKKKAMVHKRVGRQSYHRHYPHTVIQHTASHSTKMWDSLQFSSVQVSRSVVSDSLRPHESQHARRPCSSPSPGVLSNLCPLCRWCHPAISSSVVPFSSCPQSLPASESSNESTLIVSFPNIVCISFKHMQRYILLASGEGNGTPVQYSWLEHPIGQRSLEGCNSWGHKESDMT